MPDLDRYVRTGGFGFDAAGLLRRSARRHLDDQVIAQLHDLRPPEGTALDAIDGFNQQARLRRWFGTSHELDNRNRLFPLYSLPATQVAFAIGSRRRRLEAVPFELIRATCPDLATLPFAPSAWPASLVADLPDAERYPTSPDCPPWRPPRSGSLARWRRTGRRSRAAPTLAAEQRTMQDIEAKIPVLKAHLDLGPNHELFRYLDHDATMRAVDDLAQLDFLARRSVHDAVTAAMWAAGPIAVTRPWIRDPPSSPAAGSSLMFAFVVASARPGRVLPDHLDATLDLIEQRDLLFPPAHRLRWRSDDGRVLVAAWEPPDQLGIGRRWEERPSGVTLLGGLTWLDQQPWTNDRPLLAQFADALAVRPIDQRVDDLSGEFTVVSLGSDGSGTVTADALGMSMLVRGAGDGLVVASNLPAAAARLLVRPGQQPPRDVEAAAWLVYGSYLQENRTGFTGVSRVPEGAHLVIAPDRALEVVVRDRWPWWDGVRASDQDVDEVVSSAADALARNVVLAASMPSLRRAFELTGGHDSRLVLSLALRAGVQHEFSYLTWGEPGLPDLDVALALASRFELDHLGDPRPGHRPAVAPGPLPLRGGAAQTGGRNAGTGGEHPPPRVGHVGHAVRPRPDQPPLVWLAERVGLRDLR